MARHICSICPRKFAFICGSLLFLICLAAPALAQHGGKAEPLRIEFKRGATSTTVSGSVRNSEEYEYVLAAKKGQRLWIRITSTPVKSSVFQLLGEDQDTLGLEHDANFDVSIVLPKDGDYFINVSRPTTTKGSSRFTLAIAIK
ncbi:MAG TPA: PPC domain-containing protein [Pyrinomonadaceae bacterium]|nr:PPC domain-containing protein [Pyrinomonadaceae bacterium]